MTGIPGEMQWNVARYHGRQAQHSRKRWMAVPLLAGPARTKKGCRASLYRPQIQSTIHVLAPTGSISKANSCVSSSVIDMPSSPLPNLQPQLVSESPLWGKEQASITGPAPSSL